MKKVIFLSEKKRIYTMDEIRGFCILCMVIFHGFFTAGFLFHVQPAQAVYYFFVPLQPFFAAAFIVISGISTQLSRSNLKRGIKLLALAFGVTLVTVLFLPGNEIYFGILHFLAVSILLFIPLQKVMDKIPVPAGLILSAILFFITYGVAHGALGVPELFSYTLPQTLYGNNLLMLFGFHDGNFTSADYFPLLPWFFAFLFGTFLGRYAVQKRVPRFMYVSRVQFFSFVGKHTLLIYILHQPVIYGILYACTLIANW